MERSWSEVGVVECSGGELEFHGCSGVELECSGGEWECSGGEGSGSLMGLVE